MQYQQAMPLQLTHDPMVKKKKLPEKNNCHLCSIYSKSKYLRQFICDVILRDLVPFVQFKKREKHQWRSVSFSKVLGFQPATLLKVTLLHECFSRFLLCTNGTKSRKTSHINHSKQLNLLTANPTKWLNTLKQFVFKKAPSCVCVCVYILPP